MCLKMLKGFKSLKKIISNRRRKGKYWGHWVTASGASGWVSYRRFSLWESGGFATRKLSKFQMENRTGWCILSANVNGKTVTSRPIIGDTAPNKTMWAHAPCPWQFTRMYRMTSSSMFRVSSATEVRGMESRDAVSLSAGIIFQLINDISVRLIRWMIGLLMLPLLRFFFLSIVVIQLMNGCGRRPIQGRRSRYQIVTNGLLAVISNGVASGVRCTVHGCFLFDCLRVL